LLPGAFYIVEQRKNRQHEGRPQTESISVKLIDRTQRSSPELAGELYDRYHQGIYRYLYYRTGDPKIAEDLTADVFLRMVQSLGSIRPERTPLSAWLFQVARNLVIDHYRRSAAHPVVNINENLDGGEPAVDKLVERRLTSDVLAGVLGRIEETQRDVLLLRFIEGLPIAETARILQKSEDAVKALQYRGLITLRSLLQIQEED
jgi:RNA polymerase sigma-70 factor (ECF subfamily)